MDYLELYTKRVMSEGDNVGDALRENTHSFKNKKFKDSTTYRLAKVYTNKGTDIESYDEVDIRVIEIDRQGAIRNILFRPLEERKVGNIIEFDDTLWLAYDIYGSKVDDIKLRVSKINDTLKWIGKDGNINEIPCITSTSYLGSGSKSNDTGLSYNIFDVRVPLGKILMFAELNKLTTEIVVGQRFICGKKVYRVEHVDDISVVDKDYYGVLQFSLKIDLKYNEKDDFKNGIAYNDIWDNPNVPTEPENPDENEGWEW